jgi:hypothetical protein
MVITFLPALTVMPFFCNTREGKCLLVSLYLLEFIVLATFIYNMYYAWQSFVFLMRLLHWEDFIVRQNRVVPVTTTRNGGGSHDPPRVQRNISNTPNDRLDNVCLDSSPQSGSGERAAGGGAADPVAATRLPIAERQDRSELYNYQGSSALDVCVPNGRLAFPENETEEGAKRMTGPWVRVLKIIAWKSLGHALTSTLVSMLVIPFFSVIVRYWPVVKLLGMHLWFNWRLENILCPPPTLDVDNVSLGRDRREMAVIMWNRERRRVMGLSMGLRGGVAAVTPSGINVGVISGANAGFNSEANAGNAGANTGAYAGANTGANAGANTGANAGTNAWGIPNHGVSFSGAP